MDEEQKKSLLTIVESARVVVEGEEARRERFFAACGDKRIADDYRRALEMREEFQLRAMLLLGSQHLSVAAAHAQWIARNAEQVAVRWVAYQSAFRYWLERDMPSTCAVLSARE